MIRNRLTAKGALLQIPIGSESEFKGVVDVIAQDALIWDGDDAEPVRSAIPAAVKAQGEEAYASLVESICKIDDELLDEWLSKGEVTADALTAAIRRATIDGTVIPILCGSALRHVGIQLLLDGIVSYLPSPMDGSQHRADELGVTPDGGLPPHAVAFKVANDRHVGHLTWVRVFSGQLTTGQTLLNPRTRVAERIARIYRMHGKKREHLACVEAGDVVALAGVKSAVTGDTLCDPDQPPSTLISAYDTDTEEETLAGMGELHLEVAVDRLRTEFGISAFLGPTQIAYQETVRRAADETGTYRHQSGGHGHYAQVRVHIEPLASGTGVVFNNESDPPGGPDLGRGYRPGVPDESLRSVELGIGEALSKGVLAGYPMQDVKVTLLGGRYHGVDSSGMDFRIAASMAVRRAARRAQPALVEPVMTLDVVVAEEYIGAVTSDLARRRCRILSLEQLDKMRRIAGEVPLDEVRGYVSRLRSLTQGRCSLMLEFRKYDVVLDDRSRTIVQHREEQGSSSCARLT